MERRSGSERLLSIRTPNAGTVDLPPGMNRDLPADPTRQKDLPNLFARPARRRPLYLPEWRGFEHRSVPVHIGYYRAGQAANSAAVRRLEAAKKIDLSTMGECRIELTV